MAGLTISTDAAPEAWDAFVDAHGEGTFFHRAGWARLAAQAFHHRAIPLAARRNGELVGVLPLVEVRSALFGHALISNAFCVGGGPLARDTAAREALLARAIDVTRERRADYLELRDCAVAGEGWHLRTDLYETFARSIAPGEDECLRQVPRKERAVLRKALGQPFDVTIGRDIDTFYRLYARTMRRHGTPALPRRYFALLVETFARDCDVLTVWRGSRPLSSVLSFYFRDRVMPYYTGSLTDAREMGANDLMYFRLMRHAAARGCRVFDFGRSRIGTGAHAFKKNWGFAPRPVAHAYYLAGRSTLPRISPANPRYAPLIAVWRRLPLPLATFLSRFVSGALA
jgi:FemAB-related protein (PEP-CTERM system-associated)